MKVSTRTLGSKDYPSSTSKFEDASGPCYIYGIGKLDSTSSFRGAVESCSALAFFSTLTIRAQCHVSASFRVPRSLANLRVTLSYVEVIWFVFELSV
jgi:hypothetical protein